MKTTTKLELRPFVSVSKVAKAFGVSKATVREWAKTNALPAKKIGKQWYFLKSAVYDSQSMGDALNILGGSAQPSKIKIFDLMVDNTRVEIKSSCLHENEKRGQYWTFTNIHLPENSDYYLLLGYNKKRTELEVAFYIPTKDLFEKFPQILTPKADVFKLTKKHEFEGRSFIVPKNDIFFNQYLLTNQNKDDQPS